MNRNLTLAVTVAAFLGIIVASLSLVDTCRQSKMELVGSGRKEQGASSTTVKTSGNYFDLVDKILLAFADDITALAGRVGDVGKNNAVLKDPVWLAQTSSLLSKVEQTAVAIRSLPGFPRGCQVYDSEVRRMAADISFITTYLPGGLRFGLAPRYEACVGRLVAMTTTVQALPRLKQECTSAAAGSHEGRPGREATPAPGTVEDEGSPDSRTLGAFVPGLPNGWRDLRFGMTEQTIRRVIGTKWARHGERRWERIEWRGPTLPILAADGRFANAKGSPEMPLKELELDNVDSAFDHMTMWFFKGKLISLLVKPTRDAASNADLIHKATEAYGVPPRFVQIVFAAHGVPGAFSDQDDIRDVAMWRNEDAAVMMWSFIETFFEESRFYIFSKSATAEAAGFITQKELAAARARQKADEDRKAAITF